ncbi:flavin reductase family protein [Chryseolinea lacunae]|uniref:Flavin reductase family protein n=1 Tax=Chryseolinea lacunae TaxID=2801331 RepID=A0ABS1KUP2_9BACT|nr:flavin reductase family protein [Chryseolinea lacunae]MBL0742903.1 flavin reductase family protein [Chryseolinea lacunae]
MLTIDPHNVSLPELHQYLLGAVTPRPIAFASTIDREGNVNLSPFSFFNCFGYNPPLLVFSPARRGRDNTTKHTLENVLEVPEVVINIVNYAMVQQTSLASVEYPRGVNEFVKAGFTEAPSRVVRPPRVAESPVSFECKVTQVINTGDGGGAGNLVLCEVVMIHVNEAILDDRGKIDPFKLDVVARLGGDWYCRVQADAIFKVPKPLQAIGIGFDQIPLHIRNSRVLTGNNLGMLGNVEKIPGADQIAQRKSTPEFHQAKMKGEEAVHRLAQGYLEQGQVVEAWTILLA